MNKFFYILFAAVFAVSCSKGREENTIYENKAISSQLLTIYVESTTQIRPVTDATGVELLKDFFSVRVGNLEDWWETSKIENFTFEKGYSYELIVKETEYEKLLPTGSKFKYELVREVSKTKK